MTSLFGSLALSCALVAAIAVAACWPPAAPQFSASFPASQAVEAPPATADATTL